MMSTENTLAQRILRNLSTRVVADAAKLAGHDDTDFIREISQVENKDGIEVKVAVELPIDKPITLVLTPARPEPQEETEEVSSTPELIMCDDSEL